MCIRDSICASAVTTISVHFGVSESFFAPLKEISKFPAVSRDLALLVDKAVTFEQIEKVARSCEKKLLRKVTLFDVYEGNNLEAGKKSYAVNFTLQDEQKTMNDKQTDAVMQKIIAGLEKQLGARLR